MTTAAKSAGATERGPLLPGETVGCEAFLPLQRLQDTLSERRQAMDLCGCPAFAFSSLNMIPKIMLAKWTLTDNAPHRSFALTSADGTTRVLPYGTVTDYFQSILALLERKTPLALVPEHIAQHFKKSGYKVKKQHDEYIMATSDVMGLPGGRNKRLRNYVNKASDLSTVERFDPSQLAEYKALVKVWYRQNVDLKFRTYDKTSNDWLLENWTTVQKLEPTAICLGVRCNPGEQLMSLSMACQLSDRYWTAYTERYDRNAPVKGCNWFGYTQLGRAFPGLDYANDGTADTTSIREAKDRLVCKKLTFYTVTA